MQRKVTIQGKTWGFYTVEDVTDFYKDVRADQGKEGADAYFREGIFTDEQVQKANGDHFLYGYMENLAQSDRCPDFLYQSGESFIYIVEDPDAFDDELTRLRTELTKLKTENEQIKSLTLQKMLQDSEGINMGFGGAPAKAFMASLVKFFEDNGGENFLTMTAEMEDHKYSITIENLHGKRSAAEEIDRLKRERDEAKAQTEALRNGVKS